MAGAEALRFGWSDSRRGHEGSGRGALSIFVSIAAYRDPQLRPTIEDCLAKARYRDELRFGICWQHGAEEAPLPYAGDPRFRILDVDWRASRGACWARAEIMKLYAGEDYFLQLDSHHRFVQDWDAKLIDHARTTGSPKPILTTYATPFHPRENDHLETGAMQMTFDRFTDEAIVLFRPGVIDGHETLTRSVRARFVSAHFLFTIGAFVQDVPYDPDLYFIGEEITLAIRAFTHGYDFFHPPEIIVWHEYTRGYRTKHWDDHVKTRGVELEWHQRDVASKERVKRFLAHPHVGPLGCGTVRTVGDYEAFAGISFSHRRVQDYTRKGLEPPNPPAPADWVTKIRAYRIRIPLDRAMIPVAARTDPHFWYVGFHDAEDQEIHREDVSDKDVLALVAGDPPHLAIDREFESEREPVSWTVWPVSRTAGWHDKIRGAIDGRPARATLVTALLDIGRERLEGPFARSFQEHYLPAFTRLLAVDLPMVIYVDPRHADIVWRHRHPDNTQVVPLRVEDLRAFPYFDRVQDLRGRPEWSAQTGWLRWSPQAALEFYNPLVMSKMRWLADQARDNPFGTDHLFWIDAALGTTIGECLVDDPMLGRHLAEAAGDFLFLGFPYVGSTEVHGFPREALTRIAGVPSVDRVIRGGFFGGRAAPIAEAASRYDELLATTLGAGHMGTEESVFTILSYLHPDRYRCYMVEENGLVGTFFDALREGQAERMLLPSPAPTAAAPAGVSPWAPGLVATDPEGVEKGTTTFLGLYMMQNRNAPFAWHELTRHFTAEGIRIARIIEIGTGPGGLAVLLQIYCLATGAEFITYDANGDAGQTELFKRLSIDLRVGDTTHEFVVAEIAAEIQKSGVTLLVCDGPSKVNEVNTFADFLKPGDLVMAHDYGPSREEFDRRLRGSLWSWCEITDERVEAAIRHNELDPVRPDLLLPAAWGGWVKRGRAVKRARPRGRPITQMGIYALGFNSPKQFQAWLESVEEVEPAILSSSVKLLLNNSTDPSTFPGYDELCRQYEFQQVRLGNLGINGGRVWCARHFDGETALDAMLYFEDDMLLHTQQMLCANGFRTMVPDLLARVKEIAHHEDLDFLKLSFTEFYGDHVLHWGYHNLNAADRAEYFPDGPGTRIEAIKSYRGLSYLVGDVFYSNWPMLVTRRGNRTLFLEDLDVPLFEQLLMVRALKLARAGALKGGVLLASPIRHERHHHYAAEERKEC